MKGLIIVITLFTASIAFSQNDKKSTSVVIPKSIDRETDANRAPATREVEAKNESKFNPIQFKPINKELDYKIQAPNQGYKIGENANNKFNNDEKFTAPYTLQREIVVKAPNTDDSKVFKRNQSFGQLVTKSEMVKLRFRDYAAVDGDRIKIMVNGLVIRADANLIASYQTVEIGLTPGFNNLEFEALNQGTSGPNTAQFSIVDDTGKVLIENRWDLATGFKGSVMIIKD